MRAEPTRAERERPLVEQRIREDVYLGLSLIFSEFHPVTGLATMTLDFDKLNDASRAIERAAQRASHL